VSVTLLTPPCIRKGSMTLNRREGWQRTGSTLFGAHERRFKLNVNRRTTRARCEHQKTGFADEARTVAIAHSDKNARSLSTEGLHSVRGG
jgi:hypothetical protein